MSGDNLESSIAHCHWSLLFVSMFFWCFDFESLFRHVHPTFFAHSFTVTPMLAQFIPLYTLSLPPESSVPFIPPILLPRCPPFRRRKKRPASRARKSIILQARRLQTVITIHMPTIRDIRRLCLPLPAHHTLHIPVCPPCPRNTRPSIRRSCRSRPQPPLSDQT